MTDTHRVAFALAAHPDDIEFMMAGTLILLKQAGYEIHYMTVANGSCGTMTLPHAEIVGIREKEARAAAALVGATFHPSLVDDIGIFYEQELLAALGAIVRQVNPSIMLIPSPEEYMEDHANTCRLAVTAAFCRGMRNFVTNPHVRPVERDVMLYHALPYGLRDPMRRRVIPELYVDTTSVMKTKTEMLAQHRSQKEWLDASQGMDSYLHSMQELAAEVGRLSGHFRYAEGWRRHSHIGFSANDGDPLAEVLGNRVVYEKAYERILNP